MFTWKTRDLRVDALGRWLDPLGPTLWGAIAHSYILSLLGEFKEPLFFLFSPVEKTQRP